MTMTKADALPLSSPLRTRLRALAPLSGAEMQALAAAERDQRRWPARREMIAEGAPITQARAIVSGWACRQRILPDGRRQILDFLLPGDLIGVSPLSNPLAPATILAVTEVVTCALPAAAAGMPGLSHAYTVSAALTELYTLAQVTRLGRLSAQERLADWLLETRDRLALAGQTVGDNLPVPLTQELLADALGLTSVHVNRTLQSMRRDGLLAGRSGMFLLADRQRLEILAGYRSARVTADTEP
ncbi:Crp/Fnr family transcriptional regulator [Sphingomonas jeddahensis]|nr:Crp/Fnr family transcriptional regulator [Sphingomonas jeddahensis]